MAYWPGRRGWSHRFVNRWVAAPRFRGSRRAAILATQLWEPLLSEGAPPPRESIKECDPTTVLSHLVQKDFLADIPDSYRLIQTQVKSSHLVTRHHLFYTYLIHTQVKTSLLYIRHTCPHSSQVVSSTTSSPLFYTYHPCPTSSQVILCKTSSLSHMHLPRLKSRHLPHHTIPP